jgi:hypothetical protein
MNTINTTMSPNPAGNGFTGGAVGGGNTLSSHSIVEKLAKIMEKENQDFNNMLNQAEGTDDKQQNTAMLKLQQKMGEVNTTQSTATSCIQGLTDAQKETARASH